MKKLIIDNNNYYLSYKQEIFAKKDSDNIRAYEKSPADLEFQNRSILFLHGLMSDMNGSKAEAIEKFCYNNNINFVAFDNLGHGNSSGKLVDFGISDWLRATKYVIEQLELKNIIIIGSSLGGWLALKAAMEGIEEIKALILIAPAPDFTENIIKNLSKEQSQKLANNDIIHIKGKDDNSGIPISAKLLEDGKKNIIMHNEEIKLKIPVHIIQGMMDEEVSYKTALELAEKITSPNLVTKLIKYGDHRLSKTHDIEIICNSIEELILLQSK